MINNPPQQSLSVLESDARNVVLRRQNEQLKKLVAEQQDKIDDYKFRLHMMEMNNNTGAIEKLERVNTDLWTQLLQLKNQIHIVEGEETTLSNQIQLLKQENEQLKATVEKIQEELASMKDFIMSNVKLLVLGQLAFTFEYYVNQHKGNTKKSTPFKTMVDQSTRANNPIPLPNQLTSLFTIEVDESVLSYEVEQLKNLRGSVAHINNHKFQKNSVTENEFRLILKDNYAPSNDDAIEFIIDYIKNANNGVFELK